MPNAHAITPIDLCRLVGTPACPEIIDVTSDEDFALDPHLIPGATRMAHTGVAQMLKAPVKNPLIFVCQKGKKLSQGAVAYVHSAGGTARYLEGGNEAWRKIEGAPRWDTRDKPWFGHSESLWVCPTAPSLEINATGWLIRRFIDRNALFLCVSAKEVSGVADRFGATPIVEISGSLFEEHLSAFGLHSPALSQLAMMFAKAREPRHTASETLPDLAGLVHMMHHTANTHHDALHQFLPICDALYFHALTTARAAT